MVENLMHQGQQFRLGIAGWVVTMEADAVVAWALYLFLNPINQSCYLCGDSDGFFRNMVNALVIVERGEKK